MKNKQRDIKIEFQEQGHRAGDVEHLHLHSIWKRIEVIHHIERIHIKCELNES